jgi:hypothetical protein
MHRFHAYGASPQLLQDTLARRGALDGGGSCREAPEEGLALCSCERSVAEDAVARGLREAKPCSWGGHLDKGRTQQGRAANVIRREEEWSGGG